MPESGITKLLKQRAVELGFQLCGICPSSSPAGSAKLSEWLAAGYAGQMNYIEARQEAYSDPNHVLEGVRSLMMLGMLYSTSEPTLPNATQGRVAKLSFKTVVGAIRCND